MNARTSGRPVSRLRAGGAVRRLAAKMTISAAL
jgi:hypothetical protein